MIAAAVVGASCSEPSSVARHAASATIAPVLTDLLVAAAPTDTEFVIVQFDDATTSGAAVASRIQGLGAGARALTQLPFVGVLATPAQVQTIATQPGVIQISPNSQLRYLGGPGGALAGFDYILQHQDDYNIKVVNNSWGTSGPFDPKDPINVAT
ncbi:MAG: hypothetical protein DMD29_07060, partial [Gemmatimonadetes bacterium]